jgi:hypothetical protein
VVASVVGISGIYPQIIDAQWARGHSPGATHSETVRNSLATVRKRRRCPAFARCKASFNLGLAASSLPFFERQSKR